MFHEESLVTSLFKFLNVIVLFVLGIYFFKTRLIKQIKEAIAQKRHEEAALQEEKRVAKNKLKMIEDEIIEQQLLSAKLKNNITVWNEKIAHEQNAATQDQQERINEQENRVKIQSAHVTKLRIQRAVLPQALESAQIELERDFIESRGHAYMQQIIHRMRRV